MAHEPGEVAMSAAPPRILCVEDDPAQARLLRRTLEPAGYEVCAARDGETALQSLAAEPFDVLVIDHGLPGISGLDVLRSLAAAERMPAAIMVTATGDASLAVEAMKLGASDYVVKDSAGEYLHALPSVVARVLALRELQRTKQQAEDALRQEKAFIEHALNTLEDNFYVIDGEGRFLRWNRALCEQTGYTDAEVAVIAPEGLFVPEDRARVVEVIRQVWEDGSVHLEATVLTKDGRRLPFECNGSLLLDADGTPIGICGTSRDVTERHAAREALHRRTDELNERVKELTCLLGISRLLDEEDLSLDELLQRAVDLVPPAMRYPDIAV